MPTSGPCGTILASCSFTLTCAMPTHGVQLSTKQFETHAAGHHVATAWRPGPEERETAHVSPSCTTDTQCACIAAMAADRLQPGQAHQDSDKRLHDLRAGTASLPPLAALLVDAGRSARGDSLDHTLYHTLRAHLAEVDGLDARDDLPGVRLRAAGHTAAAGPSASSDDWDHERGAGGDSAAAAAAL